MKRQYIDSPAHLENCALFLHSLTTAYIDDNIRLIVRFKDNLYTDSNNGICHCNSFDILLRLEHIRVTNLLLFGFQLCGNTDSSVYNVKKSYVPNTRYSQLSNKRASRLILIWCLLPIKRCSTG